MKPKATLFSGRRYTTARHAINQNNCNIKIQAQATVEKILLKDNYEAYAVKYCYLGNSYLVRARKGIILSAGVIGTPKILMLSGIGPKAHLESVNIKPRINLPVGDNLQDHVATGLDLVLLNKSLDFSMLSLVNPIAIFNFFVNGKGPWATLGVDALGFLDKNTLNFKYGKNSDKNQPELQFMIMPVGVSADDGARLQTLVGLKPDVYDQYFAGLNQTTAVTFLPVVLHPKSRGSVRLKEKHAGCKPIINPKYLSDQYDIDTLVKGIQWIKMLIKTAPMRELGAYLNPTKFPGCEGYIFDTEEYWECYIQQLTLSAYHPVGTCAMGSVVDSEFRVLRTNKLYVVDGSVMPKLVSGNVNAAIVMLAEKAADTIIGHDYMNSEVSSAQEVVGAEGPTKGPTMRRKCNRYWKNYQI